MGRTPTTKSREERHLACWYGHLDFVKVLIEHGGANVNAKDNEGKTPLHEACDNGKLELVQLLLNQGREKLDMIETTQEGATTLQLASEQNHLACVWF